MEPDCKRKKMSQETGILDLPNEILEPIFLMLSQKDRQQNLALVCRRFLEITRNPNFVQDVKIKLIPSENNPARLKKSCWERVEKVLRIYPQCKIELYHEAMFLFNEKVEIIGYSWMSNFSPFAASITKMTLNVTHRVLRNFSDFIVLENLEYLDITIKPRNVDAVDAGVTFVPQDLKAEFWNNFPKLKSLKFTLDRWMNGGIFENDDFDKFTIPISTKCQDLESFVYYGFYSSFKPGLPRFGAPSNDKDKFSNLKYIKAEFTLGQTLHKDDLWKLDANLENFKNYLTIKCPNLEIPIRIDVVKLEVTGPEGESGWTKYEEVTFESK